VAFLLLIMSKAQMGLILRKVSEGGGVTKGQWTFVTLHKKLNASIAFRKRDCLDR
jgi:hypothetical protein